MLQISYQETLMRKMQPHSSKEKIFPLKFTFIYQSQNLLLKQIGKLFIQVSGDFENLLRSAHQTQAHLFAPGTRKNIKSHIRQFVLFCCHFKRQVVPASRETLVAFFELFSTTATYDHLKNVQSSIKFLHKALNVQYIEDDFQINTILQSIKRKLAKKPFQVLPITPRILLDLYKFIDIRKSSDLALWSSFLVSFYCLFRKANVVPKTLEKFDPSRELSRQKIMVLDDCALVYKNFSKTNQFMSRSQFSLSVLTKILHLIRFYILRDCLKLTFHPIILHFRFQKKVK